MLKNIEKKKVIIIAIGIFLGIFLIVKILDIYYQSGINNISTVSNIVEEIDEDNEDETIIVYITGEVKKEGVIELPSGSRISDAIDKAGGLKETANIKQVNLAYELEDGQKIYIPNKNDKTTDIEIIDDGDDMIVDDNMQKSSLININKANSEELQKLKGIGEMLSQNIVEYREENGKFAKIEDLMKVPGIGQNKFENIKENIKVK